MVPFEFLSFAVFLFFLSFFLFPLMSNDSDNDNDNDTTTTHIHLSPIDLEAALRVFRLFEAHPSLKQRAQTDPTIKSLFSSARAVCGRPDEAYRHNKRLKNRKDKLAQDHDKLAASGIRQLRKVRMVGSTAVRLLRQGDDGELEGASGEGDCNDMEEGDDKAAVETSKKPVVASMGSVGG